MAHCTISGNVFINVLIFWRLSTQITLGNKTFLINSKNGEKSANISISLNHASCVRFPHVSITLCALAKICNWQRMSKYKFLLFLFKEQPDIKILEYFLLVTKTHQRHLSFQGRFPNYTEIFGHNTLLCRLQFEIIIKKKKTNRVNRRKVSASWWNIWAL